ncbi:protein of unknown function [Methylacidimicrobium sp. AP8]|uniref:SMI1/KNR4 family protein n=1 Tax=Methylacidimicrobium sp. AP8 TaxID=2730359 RepID=UPI0018C157B4|nr:SMI1/KNR4 family protein [Methylacidimicrobium sp. AP8]CAB4243651.1 protein of unknown function [Methylacidimicrobium sp. AP8]
MHPIDPTDPLNLPPLEGFKWVELEKRDSDHPQFFPPAKPETIEAAKEWCARELGFPLPDFYVEALKQSNGYPFWGGKFLLYPEPGHPGFLEWESVVRQNRRFRTRRRPWRIASHFFVFGRFWKENYLAYDTRKGSIHLFSPLFALEDASTALVSFPDPGSFIERIVPRPRREGDPVHKLAMSLDPEIERRLLAERRPQARFDPTSLPVLQAAMADPIDDWPPIPASPEAIEEAIAEAPRRLNGYPLPLFYRDLLPYYNGFRLANGFIYCIQDKRSPVEWIRTGTKRPRYYHTCFLFSWNDNLHELDHADYGRGSLSMDKRGVNPEFFCFGGGVEDEWVEYWIYDPRTATFHMFYNDDDLSSIAGASISSPDFETFIRDMHDAMQLPVPEEEGAEKE